MPIVHLAVAAWLRPASRELLCFAPKDRDLVSKDLGQVTPAAHKLVAAPSVAASVQVFATRDRDHQPMGRLEASLSLQEFPQT